MDPSSAWTNVLVFGICCCVPPLLAAGLGGAVYIGWYLPRAQLKRLAEALGLKLDTRYGFPYHGYWGTQQGRALEMAIGGHSEVGPDSTSSLRPAQRLSVELQMKELRRGDATGYRKHVDPQAAFESIFRQEQSEWLSGAARAAMLDFVRKRADLSLNGLPDSQPGRKMFLRHTMDRLSGVPPAEVRAALDDLIEVARVIEATG